MRSGIVKGAFNEGKFFASASNIIALDTCELRISGHQVVIDSTETITLNDRPSTPTKYSMIAEIQVSDSSVPSFRLFIQPANVSLKKDNLFKTNNGSGTYQLRIGNFTLGTTGLISDVIRTADIITGGGEGGVADIKFNATATQLSSSSQPEVNIDYNEETGEYDANFGIPAGSGTNVTIGGVIQGEWSADFVEAERQKSKNLWHSTKAIDVTTSGLSVKFTPYNQKIVYNGTTDNYSYFNINSNIFLKAGTYTMSIPALSGTRTEGVQQAYIYFSATDGFFALDVDGHLTFTLDQDQYLTDIGFQSNSGITYTNYTFGIQIEKGSVATDYQPYNGSIERVEVVYDMNGGTPLDWGKTGGIYGGEVISGKDFRKYKKLIVYSYSSGNILTTIIPLTTLVSGVDSYIGCNAGLSNDTTDLQCIKCSINSTKTDFEVDAMGYYGTSGFTLRNNTSSYIVFKIEGVY